MGDIGLIKVFYRLCSAYYKTTYGLEILDRGGSSLYKNGYFAPDDKVHEIELEARERLVGVKYEFKGEDYLPWNLQFIIASPD